MKRLLAAFPLLPVLAFSAPVPSESAAELVRGYAAYTGGGLLGGVVAAPRGEPRAVTAEVEGEEVVLAWAFDMEPQGWILVAGDDRMEPVAGFSAEGALGDALWNEAAPPFHFVREMLASEYRAAAGVAPAAAGDDGDGGAAEAGGNAAAARWAKYRAAAPAPVAGGEEPPPPASPPDSVADLRVDKLLGDVMWAQSGSGENYYTPNHYVCGCVQTAWGQIFYFHRDAIGTRSVSRTGTIRVDGVSQSATTSGRPYDWDRMAPGPVPESSDPVQAEARGRLLWDIGICQGASYTAGNTTAFESPSVPVNYFGFRQAREFSSGAGYAAMTNALHCNFDAGYPCLVGCASHAVVFDGYGLEDGQVYYHANMGWGGDSDGWYLYKSFGGPANNMWANKFIYNLFPDRTGEIVSGRVLDAAGAPVAGATVTVRSADGSFAQTATSRANGIWAVAGVPSGATVSVAAAASGLVFEARSVSVGTSVDSAESDSCGNRWGIDFTGVSATGATVYGTVSTPAGRPVAGILVEASGGAGSARTGAGGGYAIAVPVGWSGTVAPAAGQGIVSSQPASHSVSALAAGGSAQCDFVVRTVLHVDSSATGTGDGTTWESAFPSLVDALAAASAGAEIWVAAGTYKPTAGNSRATPFVIPSDVSVYGGFAGTETSRDQRDWRAHETVLSGEIGNASSAADNSLVLVVGSSRAVLDGFTVTGAFQGDGDYVQNFPFADSRWEGAICAVTGTDDASAFDFRVEHCLIRGNTFHNVLAKGWVLFTSCVFTGNAKSYSLCYLFQGCSVQNCSFAGNNGLYFNYESMQNGAFPHTRFRNNYFGDTGVKYYHYSLYEKNRNHNFGDGNLHLAEHRLQGTTNRADFVFVSAAEALSSDPATPAMPPAASRAVDAGEMILSYGAVCWAGLTSGWETTSTDFLGNPRLHGSAIDVGAYEIDPSGYVRPPAGTVSAAATGLTTATATVNVTSLGDGASSVAITLEYSTSASFSSRRTVDLGAVGTTGPKSAALASLAPGTTYYVRAVLVGAKTYTTAAATFTTDSFTAPTLDAVSVSTTKAAATLTVPVTSLGDGGASVTVSATLGGATKTATLSAPGEATFVFDGLTADTEYAWSVSAVAAPTGLAATPQSGVATTQGVQKETKGWFFVDLSDAGYAAFPDVSGVAAPGGTWSGAGEYSATYSAAGRTLAIARSESAAADAELRYTPTKPTESGCDAEVRGTFVPNPHATVAGIPQTGALAGIAFVSAVAGLRPYGLAGGTWTPQNPVVANGAPVAWAAQFDFSSARKPRVRYAIGAVTNDWMSMSAATKLSAVAFRGSGTLGSFRGTYARVVGSFAKPEFGAASADGSALGFGTDPATGRATFSVTIDNATDDADYAVYVCDTVGGDYVLDAAATQSGAGEFRTFTMVDDAATKFVKIVAAEPGYAFPEHFADLAF